MSGTALLAARAQAAMFFSLFGSAWLLWGIAVGFPSNRLLLVVSAVIGAALFVAARRTMKSNRDAQEVSLQPQLSAAQRQFRRINTVQWITIVSIGSFLALIGKQNLVIPVVVAIAGIHFLPLAVLFGSRAHLTTGVALIAVACANPLLSKYAEHQAGIGIGAGVVLLISAAYGLTGAVQRR